MSLGYWCDICGLPLKLEYIDYMHTYKTYRTKEWDTKSLYPCLCESCAGKLDAAIKKVKDEAVLNNLIAARNTKLNAERKQKLGTKG